MNLQRVSVSQHSAFQFDRRHVNLATSIIDLTDTFAVKG